jgi:hypothetical protein
MMLRMVQAFSLPNDGAFAVSLELILFILRIASALLLLFILAVVLYTIWREHQAIIQRIQASRRSYGQLVAIVEVDEQYMTTGESYPLLPLTTFGRSSTNTIILKDTFASGEHARIYLKDGQWWLEDCNSRNGTTLNELPIREHIIMTNGDIIGIGETRFRLELE